MTSGDDGVLDALVWHALTSAHRHVAVGDGMARRYEPAIAMFAAVEADAPSAWDALEAMAEPGEALLLSGDVTTPPATWVVEWEGLGHQMVLDELAPSPALDHDIVELTAADVPAMLALVELTRPGPFRSRTVELGHYVGVEVEGELVAMAGERLQTPAFGEVSAVCTHPTVRGRGLAAALTHRVAAGILARGQTPLLHVATTNVGARRVYERLGFRVRRDVPFVLVRTPGAPG